MPTGDIERKCIHGKPISAACDGCGKITVTYSTDNGTAQR